LLQVGDAGEIEIASVHSEINPTTKRKKGLFKQLTIANSEQF